MLFYAAALQTLNYDWDTLKYRAKYQSGPAWTVATAPLPVAEPSHGAAGEGRRTLGGCRG